MGEEKEKATGATWESDLDKFLAACDVVSINLPLSDKTRFVNEFFDCLWFEVDVELALWTVR